MRAVYTPRVTNHVPEVVQRLQLAFEPHRDVVKARAMSAYMRDRFPFLGIPSPERRAIQRTAVAFLRRPAELDLAAACDALWRLPEREFQYAALDLLTGNIRRCGPDFIATAHELITTKSWWDTVDALASRVVGPLVLASPGLATTMDGWVEDPNLWLRRTAILH